MKSTQIAETELHKFYTARGLDLEYSFEKYKKLAERAGIKITNKGEQK